MGLLTGLRKLWTLGYDAADSSPRRRAVATHQTEDMALPDSKRRVLIGTTHDLLRNYSAAKWCVNKHLDYVSSFHFQARTNIDWLDTQIEDLMYWWSQPRNCDIAGRHDLRRLTRLMETRATVDGDGFSVKLASGQLQGISADRVRTPTAKIDIAQGYDIVNGVIIDQGGAMVGICVHNRNGSGYVFDRVIPGENIIQHGYFDTEEQIRGVSPLASSLNVFRDLLEASEYNLISAKIRAMFGLKITKPDTQPMPGDGTSTSEYSLDELPLMLNLDPGQDAEFMESGAHPSDQFQHYMQVMLGVAMKGLDIPMSFYDESLANYSSSRSAWIHYNISAENKRANLRRVLDEITIWKLATWVAAGMLTLPQGMRVSQLNWEWVSHGVPWLNPLQEVNADIAGVNSSLTSRQRLCRERGEDWYEVVKELKAEQDKLIELGLSPTATPLPITIQGA